MRWQLAIWHVNAKPIPLLKFLAIILLTLHTFCKRRKGAERARKRYVGLGRMLCNCDGNAFGASQVLP